MFHFEPHLKLMSTADRDHDGLWLHTKGAPESVLARCDRVLDAAGAEPGLDEHARRAVDDQVAQFSERGMRLIAVARRRLPAGELPSDRDRLETGLTLLGLVAMEDPPRPEVADAVAACHQAGIRILVITGDHPLTAGAIARRHVVAMTGDGVNDAPALRQADIGVAMGLSGTDVAREAATMVLSDDNFATIVAAISAGRRVYDNVRKFIVYIFAHATPEVVPFIVFAFGGGLMPLLLTVLQILAFDVGSETLPSLALARDPAEPGIMDHRPRPSNEGVITAPMLARAWLFLGVLVAALEMAGFFFVLHEAGWHPGAPTGPGHPLHHAYLQATTMSFVGMMAGQIGTAFAVRTRRESLRSIGIFSNRYLLAAIGGVILFAAAFVYIPPLQSLLGTAALPPRYVLFLLPLSIHCLRCRRAAPLGDAPLARRSRRRSPGRPPTPGRGYQVTFHPWS